MLFLNRTYQLRMSPPVVRRLVWLLLCLLITGVFGARFPDLSLTTLPMKVAVYVLVVAGFAALLTETERGRVRTIVEWVRVR